MFSDNRVFKHSLFLGGYLPIYATIQIGKQQKKTRRMDFGKETQPPGELNVQPNDTQENTNINLHEKTAMQEYKGKPRKFIHNLCPAKGKTYTNPSIVKVENKTPLKIQNFNSTRTE